MWERACSRIERLSRHQRLLRHRFREQARSHRFCDLPQRCVHKYHHRCHFCVHFSFVRPKRLHPLFLTSPVELSHILRRKINTCSTGQFISPFFSHLL
ncbi:hypothetical protein DJ564_10295 [Pseudomonas sp. 31-12]|nr:hypothetical protein DJ564_10295 [Pseudomonas sp. 31-12]